MEKNWPQHDECMWYHETEDPKCCLCNALSERDELREQKANLHMVINLCGDQISALKKICDDLYYGRTGSFGRLEEGMFAYEEKFIDGQK